MLHRTLAKAFPVLLMKAAFAQERSAARSLNPWQVHARTAPLASQQKTLGGARRTKFGNMAKCNSVAKKCR